MPFYASPALELAMLKWSLVNNVRAAHRAKTLMDEIRIRHNTTPSVAGKANTVATTSSSPQAVKSAQASSPPESTTSIKSLIASLKNTAEIRVEVSSTQVLNHKTQQLLAKVNPSLANTILQENTTKQGQTATQDSRSPLYLVKLAHASSSATILTTVTPVAFKVGDKLQLQLNSQQQIVIKPSVASVRPAIAEGLKSALPTQQAVSHALKSISQLEQLPNSIQKLLLPQNTPQLLKNISQFIQSSQSLSSGAQVKSALINSGIFTEQKLQSQQPLNNDLRTSLNQLNSLLQSALANAVTGRAEISHQGLSINSNNNGNLSTVDNSIVQLLNQLSSTPTTTTTSNNTTPTLAQNITALLQLFGFKFSGDQSTDLKKAKEAINKQLSQMSNAAQEKIQLNQLRSLNLDAPSSDNASVKNPSITTEIPLRWGDQVLPLQITIREETSPKQEQETKEKEKQSTITRRWQVFLSFDLPSKHSATIEQLHTQLLIIDDTVSATLWTESRHLCETAKKHLQDLRNNMIAKGLKVEDLCCINGKPPNQELSLDYNLVDIVT
jgi:hypothetical protein